MQLSKPTTFILGLFGGAIVAALVGITVAQQGYVSADVIGSEKPDVVELETQRPCGWDEDHPQCGGYCEDKNKDCGVRIADGDAECGCFTDSSVSSPSSTSTSVSSPSATSASASSR